MVIHQLSNISQHTLHEQTSVNFHLSQKQISLQPKLTKDGDFFKTILTTIVKKCL